MDRIKSSIFNDLIYNCRWKPPVRTITFAAPSSTLTNFPCLVKCNRTFHIGTETGYDVHFQDLSGTELYFDLDFYDSTTGNGAWWVRVPSLPSSGPTSIKMLYGDSGAVTNGSSPSTVWSGYSNVYHFADLDNLSSVVGSYTMTEGHTDYCTRSIVSNPLTGRGMRFWDTRGYGDSYYSLSLGNGFEVSTGTISVLATSTKTSWAGDRWVDMNTGWNIFCFRVKETQFEAWAGGISATFNRSDVNGFYCYGGSCSPSAVGWSVNGVIQNTSSASPNYFRWGSPKVTITGYPDDPSEIIFDEIRISSSTYRPSAWLQYEQLQTMNHASYTTYSPERAA